MDGTIFTPCWPAGSAILNIYREQGLLHGLLHAPRIGRVAFRGGSLGVHQHWFAMYVAAMQIMKLFSPGNHGDLLCRKGFGRLAVLRSKCCRPRRYFAGAP